jgi:hypothetical protein
MTQNYRVGYGKPPAETQWKKGQSGNPGGKRKKAFASHVGIARTLAEPTTARLPDGKKIELELMEASYFNLCRDALNGNKKSLFQAVEIMLQVLPPVTEDDMESVKIKSDEERKKDFLEAMLEFENGKLGDEEKSKTKE